MGRHSLGLIPIVAHVGEETKSIVITIVVSVSSMKKEKGILIVGTRQVDSVFIRKVTQ